MENAINISIVVAVAENNAIGLENALPWRLPADLKQFKKITLGHPVIMGRKTFESIGRPLPGRDNIIVTKQKKWNAEGVKVAPSLESALSLGAESATNSNVNEIMVIGGADIYQQVLPLCGKLYLTEVHAEITGDAYFPDLNMQEWEEVSRVRQEATEGNSHPYSFVLFSRKR